jgi:peptide/nickel transport system permease protein
VLAAATLGLITRTTRGDAGIAVAGLCPRGPRERISESRIVLGHALPNALIPVVTLGGPPTRAR